MSKKKKAKELTPEQHQARFDAAAAAVRREYCNMFEFWRACRYKLCPKARVCSGDARAIRCRMRYEAQLQIIAATPSEPYSAVKTARRFSPQGLCW
jgi:hypothetical protein